ncbi:MAG: 50S ribosomal protein L6 [Rickettsia sp.]|nr:50S ribosomal protein L6 [Rickettsia sp.]
MSRIGKNPIIIPENVTVLITGACQICVKGPLGELTRVFNDKVSLSCDEKFVKVVPNSKDTSAIAMWGTARSIINSMVLGVSAGFSTEVEIVGVGFRGNLEENFINLYLGKSHSTKIEIPSDIKISFLKPNLISVNSCNKESLGRFISLLKLQRLPEPYKGKGIFIKGEYLELKKAKKAK